MSAAPVIAAPPASVRVSLGVRVVTEGNAKGSWRAHYGRANGQRKAIRKVLPWHIRAAGWSMTDRECVEGGKKIIRPVVDVHPGPLTILLVRLSPGNGLDPHDNLPTSFKHVVDEIAALFGVPDKDERMGWLFDQRRTKRNSPTAWGIEIRIEPRV